MKETRHLYSDLAWLWPLWGDATTEYADYCRHVAERIREHSRRPAATLLDIGCGGGKNVVNLGRHFAVTGLDLSPAMLAQARELNPGCTFILDDMRTFQLGRQFDAVLLDDAMSHMVDRVDFQAAIRRAHEHLRPGGVLVATPDVTKETFQQNRTSVTTASREGLDVAFVENVFDPDPTDESYECTILYLIREHGGQRIASDHWTLGIFPLDTWRQVLRDTGFEVHEGLYDPEGDGKGFTVFTCVKP